MHADAVRHWASRSLSVHTISVSGAPLAEQRLHQSRVWFPGSSHTGNKSIYTPVLYCGLLLIIKKKVCGKLITMCNTKSSEMPRKVTRMAPVISLQSRPWSEISPSRSHRHHLPTPNILRIILNLTNQQPQPIEVKGLHDGHGFGPIRGLSLHPAHPAASPHLRRSTHYSPLSPVAIVTAI